MGDEGLGDRSASSPEQNPEETGDSLSILSPMEHLGDKGVLADSPSEDLGDTLINNWDNFEWADLLDCNDDGLEDEDDEVPEMILSAVKARVIFFLGFGWFCLDFSLFANVARKALASSFLVDG